MSCLKRGVVVLVLLSAFLVLLGCAPKPVLPVQLSLTADNLSGVLSISTTAHCLASGGNGTYSYVWSGLSTDGCSGQDCAVSISEIGNHAINCSVFSGGRNASASLVLQVTKRARQISSVIVFGDSLSYGHGLDSPENESWPALYAGTFKNAVLHNYAATGDETQEVLFAQLNKYREDTLEPGNSLVFVWIGANDIKSFTVEQDFAENYAAILDDLESTGSDVILMTIPDASALDIAEDVEQGINSLLSDVGLAPIGLKAIGKEVIIRYNKIIWQESEKRGLHVIDMFEFMSSIPDELLIYDRVHPNAAGHALIARKVREDVASFYPLDDLQ